jgi:hypothetical protein
MANFYLTGIGSLTGALATGLGFLVTASLQKSAFAAVSSQRAIVVLYAAMGIVLAVAFEKLSPAPEAHGTLPKSEGMTGLLGIGASRGIVLRLGSLFALDAFGGGVRRPEFRRVLVLSAIRRGPRNTRCNLLWRERVRGHFSCWPHGWQDGSALCGRWCLHTSRPMSC